MNNALITNKYINSYKYYYIYKIINQKLLFYIYNNE